MAAFKIIKTVVINREERNKKHTNKIKHFLFLSKNRKVKIVIARGEVIVEYLGKIRDFHFQNVLWRVVKSAEKTNKEIQMKTET